MLHAYNATRDHAVESSLPGLLYHVSSVQRAARICGASEKRAAASAGTWQCDGSKPFGTGLLLGVVSAPRNRARRIAIRNSWSRWPGQSTTVCFVVGLAGLAPSAHVSLGSEQAEFSDVVRLADVVDDCHVSFAKAFAWWIYAAKSSVPFVGRADDDTFIHVPNLEADLWSLRCHSQLAYGVVAYAGYNPANFRKCGYAWGGNANWRKYRCGREGAHEATPFLSGMVQVLSRTLATAIATSLEVRAFVERADVIIDLVSWDKTEDVALGYWLVQLLLSGAVAAPIRVAGLEPARGHNLGCRKHAGFYKRPSNRSVAIHFVKNPKGMLYLYELMRGERSHEVEACRSANGVD